MSIYIPGDLLNKLKQGYFMIYQEEVNSYNKYLNNNNK